MLKPRFVNRNDYWRRLDCSPVRSEELFKHFYKLLVEGMSQENSDGTWYLNKLATEDGLTTTEKLGMAYKFGEFLEKLHTGTMEGFEDL